MSEPEPVPRVLCVVSADFGELALARWFVAGQRFEPAFLLPPHLHERNAGGLDVPSGAYRSMADVLAVAEAFRPDLVLLASGYLFALNRLMPIADLAGMIAGLEGLRARLATTDPFLGLLQGPRERFFDPGHPAERLFAAHFDAVAPLLARLPHLHPVPVAATKARCVPFSNPRMVASADELAAHRAAVSRWLGPRDEDARWLFILSGEDHAGEISRRGEEAFVDGLVARLREARSAGGRPVVLAPDPCLDALRPRLAAPDEAVLLPFCRVDRFWSLLLDAEYVFYWNQFSNSIVLRAVNGLPCFLFDRGHLARAIPPLRAAGVEAYFGGREPELLDEAAPLSRPTLAASWQGPAEWLPALLRERWRSPDPETVVRGLLRERIG